jgi:hypothetical protein
LSRDGGLRPVVAPMSNNVIQTAFSAGEVSPSFYGRVDVTKYHVAAALLRNFYVDYRGGASSRPGSWYVGTSKYSDKNVKLARFQFSTAPNQAYALEFGHLYMRVIFQGAYIAAGGGGIYELVTPYTSDDVPLLKFNQANDIVTITHPNYQARELQRVAPNNWNLNLISFTNAVPTPATPTLTGFGANTSAYQKTYGYRVSAVINGEEGQTSPPAILTTYDMAEGQVSIKINWTAVVGAESYNIYKCQALGITLSGGSRYGYIGTTSGTGFTDTNFTPNFVLTPAVHRDPFAGGAFTKLSVTAGGTGYTPPTSTDFLPITVTDATGSGFIGYAIITSGAVTGVFVENAGKNYTAPTFSVAGGTGATFSYTLSPVNAFPSVSGYFQQRLVFANTNAAPSTLWATQPGLFKNMDVTIPVTDSNAYSFTLAGTQVNAIKYMQPMPGGLVLFTSGGVWQLSGGTGDTPVTPSNARATPQSYVGCADVQPIPINYNILYVQQKGSTVHALAYNFYANIYAGEEVSLLANHLFSPRVITSWAYLEEPYKMILAVRDDGQLLAFTYMKEQELAAWTHWDTKGVYQSICTVQEGAEDIAYVAVKRYVNGTWIQYIERFASRVLSNAESAMCVDCALSTALTYPAATVTSNMISGNVEITADTAIFSAGDIGKILRMNGGVGTVTNYLSTTKLDVTFTTPMTLFINNEDGTSTPLAAASGSWSLTPTVSALSGLNHLEGQLVTVVGDGSAQASKTVTSGAITLDVPASYVIVGLPYICQLKTLPLDTGEPTSQGKRKKWLQ